MGIGFGIVWGWLCEVVWVSGMVIGYLYGYMHGNAYWVLGIGMCIGTV